MGRGRDDPRRHVGVEVAPAVADQLAFEFDEFRPPAVEPLVAQGRRAEAEDGRRLGFGQVLLLGHTPELSREAVLPSLFRISPTQGDEGRS